MGHPGKAPMNPRRIRPHLYLPDSFPPLLFLGKGRCRAHKQQLCQHLQHESEKAMAPHSGTLAWKIPRTEEPGGLQSMGLL